MSDPLAIQATRKSLIEGKAEVRTRAAQAITLRTSQLFKDVPINDAEDLLLTELARVEEELIRNTAAAYRRAGLICVRAVSTGLPSQALREDVVSGLLDPVLRSVGDADPVVRIAAIEACYDLLRLHGLEVWRTHFTDLFAALSVAVSDRDKRVFLLAEEVSSMLKETLTRTGAEAVDMKLFASFVCDTLGGYTSSSSSPSVDVMAAVPQWILDWLRFVLGLPGCAFTLSMATLLRVLLAASVSDDAIVFDILRGCRADVSRYYSPEASADFKDIVVTLCAAVLHTTSPRTRVFCLGWLGEMMQLGVHHGSLQRLLPDILQSTLPELSSSDGAVRTAALETSQHLQQAVSCVGNNLPDEVRDALLHRVVDALDLAAGEETLVGALEWLLVLHHLEPALPPMTLVEVLSHIISLIDLATEEVSSRSIEVACELAEENAITELVRLLTQRLLSEREGLLLQRFPDVVRHFHAARSRVCPKSFRRCVLVVFAGVLSSIDDLRFVSKMVLSLQTMLTTFPEFEDMRKELRQGLSNVETAALFDALLPCWCYNGVALLSLALQCRHFALTQRICQNFGECEISIATYVQLDHMVRQLESPTFTFLRVSLLHPSTCLALVQTLFSLLLVLPQSSPQYELLSRRLDPVKVLLQLDNLSPVTPLSTAVVTPAEVLTGQWHTYVTAQEALLGYELAVCRS